MRPGANTSLPQELRDVVRRLQRVERAVSRTPSSASGGADTTPPTISSTNVVTTPTTATITWITNEPSNTQIEYGLTSGLGSATTLNNSMVNNHSQQITGLTASTTYYYRVRSADASGNVGYGPPISTFTTGSTADTTPPVVSSRVATPISDGAVITWNTNEPSNRQIEYGPTDGFGFLTTLQSNMLQSHSVTLTGLSSNTTYHYRILTRDAAGNLTTTSTLTFTTTSSFLFNSDFTGSNGAAWPAGFTITYPSDIGERAGIADIQGNAGRIQTASGGIPYGNTYRARSSVTNENLEMLIKWRPIDLGVEGYYAFSMRGPVTMPTHFETKYGVSLFFEPMWGYWYVFYGESQTVVLEGPFTFAAGTYYWTRYQVFGNTVRFKHWADGQSEPSSWLAEGTLSFTGEGKFTIYAQNGEAMAAAGIYIDNLTLTAL